MFLCVCLCVRVCVCSSRWSGPEHLITGQWSVRQHLSPLYTCCCQGHLSLARHNSHINRELNDALRIESDEKLAGTGLYLQGNFPSGPPGEELVKVNLEIQTV